MQTLKNIFSKQALFMGVIVGVPKPVIWWMIALIHCACSERLNGANVQMELAGDWILASASLFALLGFISLTMNIITKNKNV
ncbi:hypothetical protein ACFST9_04275 [Hymenobacter monticola]|uniref:ABC transporter permease n=1 Tax=Hymenobacter monticola TaxID=1705399 RepID=A0ABY4B1V5_9BACT|nr:hypothetical protein [Hymenobacter monticola]UOE32829.1 hypothetical protein MTP16_17045 [Hymenobacter monticola]